MNVQLVIFCVFLSGHLAHSQTDKIVCYFGSWAIYRAGQARFSPNDIDATLCTHMIFSFVTLDENGNIKPIDNNLSLDRTTARTGFYGFNNIKQKNRQLKTLLSVGGYDTGSIIFSKVAASASKRKTFVRDALNILQKYNFDGLDLAWNYPAQRGGDPADKENFVKLLKDLKDEFSKFDLVLSASVAAAPWSAFISYNIPEISKHLDFINVWALDLHGSWESVVAHHSPLYASDEQNIDAIVDYWLDQGASASKLVISVGTSGRSFKLADPTETSIGSYANGTVGDGSMAYYEICKKLSSGWERVWDDEQKVPFAHGEGIWVGYDDVQSAQTKVNFAKTKKLGGIMVWRVDTDDFKGVCGVKYPIIKAVYSAMNGITNPPDSTVTTSRTTSTTSTRRTTTTTTTTVRPETLCKKRGYIRNPTDCSKFIYCSANGKGGFNAYTFECPPDQLYDTEVGACEPASTVDC